ncbi:MAG: hypothetical protein ACTH0G_11515, partial [Corynebacterium variabile]
MSFVLAGVVRGGFFRKRALVPNARRALALTGNYCALEVEKRGILALLDLECVDPVLQLAGV